MTNTFSFQAGARPVFAQTKYRDEEDDQQRIACHITVDPRVVRGSAYAHHKPAETIQPIRYKPKPIPRIVEEDSQPACEEETMNDDELEPLLQPIEDRPIEDDIATAAETFIERPPTPHFIEDEPGIDVETQIEESDLFDYDSEVRPLIKVIVQHTLLRALAEVHEEVEVENISKHRERYEVERNTILAELQRLEAQFQRKDDETKRRKEQRERVQKEVQELNAAAASKGFAESYASDMVIHAMDLLEQRGFFYDEVEKEVSDVFLPWLSTQIDEALEVKELTVKVKEKAIEEADSLRKTSISQTKEKRTKEQKERDSKDRALLRKMLIEDTGAKKIGNAKRKFEEEKRKKEEELRKTEDDAEA